MNLHGCERAAACIALTLLTLYGVSVNNAFAQKRRGATGTQARANSRRRQQPPAEEDDRASGFLEEGQRYAEAGDWAAALKAYKQATAINPRDPEAHIYVGDAYMTLGKYEEAFAAYREAVRVAPSSAEAHYSLGAAYNDMGMYGDAFKPFVTAISLDSNYAEAHYGIGYAYLKLENFKEALAYLRRAVKLENDYPEAHLALGLAYLGLGQTKSAEEELEVLQGIDGALARQLEKELRMARVAAVRPETEARRSTDPAEGLAPQSQQQQSKPKGGGEPLPPTTSLPPQTQPSQVTPAEQPPPGGSPSHLAAELALWDRIKNSDDPEEFVAYLKQYPAGEFAGLARIRLRILESKRSGAGKPGGERKQEDAASQAKREDTAAATAVGSTSGTNAEAQRPPTIEETLRLLKEDFSNKLTYTATAPGEDANVVKVTSEVVIEYEPLRFDNCHIEWRDHKDTLSVALSDLDPLGIRVEPRSKPNTTFSISIWTLTFKTVGGASAIRAVKGDGSGAIDNYNSLDLQFGNKERAERVARLLQQAIRLCKSDH